MLSRPSKFVCQINRRLVSSAFLLLPTILPKFSYAQIPDLLPTTFITSATPQSPTPLSLNARQQTQNQQTQNQQTQNQQTQSPQSQNLQNNDPEEDTSSHVTNYYFVIVAVFVVLVFFLLLYITRRRKRKAELLRNNGQNALARDVQTFADFRTRFGPRRGGPGLMGMTMGTTGVHRERQEGLDERGEAPPAYKEGDKPPDFGSDDGIAMMISNQNHDNGNGSSDIPVVANAENNINTTRRNESGSESRLSAELSRPTITTASTSERHTSTGNPPTPTRRETESNQDVELMPISRSISTRPPLGPPTYSETLDGQSNLTRPAAAVIAHDHPSTGDR
jgi:hypothetical protein